MFVIQYGFRFSRVEFDLGGASLSGILDTLLYEGLQPNAWKSQKNWNITQQLKRQTTFDTCNKMDKS